MKQWLSVAYARRVGNFAWLKYLISTTEYILFWYVKGPYKTVLFVGINFPLYFLLWKPQII